MAKPPWMGDHFDMHTAAMADKIAELQSGKVPDEADILAAQVNLAQPGHYDGQDYHQAIMATPAGQDAVRRQAAAQAARQAPKTPIATGYPQQGVARRSSYVAPVTKAQALEADAERALRAKDYVAAYRTYGELRAADVSARRVANAGLLRVAVVALIALDLKTAIHALGDSLLGSSAAQGSTGHQL